MEGWSCVREEWRWARKGRLELTQNNLKQKSSSTCPSKLPWKVSVATSVWRDEEFWNCDEAPGPKEDYMARMLSSSSCPVRRLTVQLHQIVDRRCCTLENDRAGQRLPYRPVRENVPTQLPERQMRRCPSTQLTEMGPTRDMPRNACLEEEAGVLPGIICSGRVARKRTRDR